MNYCFLFYSFFIFFALSVKFISGNEPTALSYTALRSILFGFFSDLNPACLRKCDGNYKPVCGSNNVTYYNACLLAMKQCNNDSIKLVHLGECGNDLTLAHETYNWNKINDDGDAKKSKCLKPCTKNYAPICGSDGITYSNRCLFEIAQCMYKDLYLSHLNVCLGHNLIKVPFDVLPKSDIDRCKRHCEKFYNPVCGSNFKTYDNLCSYEVEKCLDSNVEILHYGSCDMFPVFIMSLYTSGIRVNNEVIKKCSRPCHKDYHPICTNIGLTAGNRCQFEYMKCIFSELEEVGKFSCEEIPILYRPRLLSSPEKVIDHSVLQQCHKRCHFEGQGVCGSNGFMFKNHCEFEVASCIDKSVEVAEDFGICKDNYEFLKEYFDEKSLDCPKTWEPVCGSNQVTYPNICFFMQDLGYVDGFYIKSSGECSVSRRKVDYLNFCKDVYAMQYKPVCDFQNIPHANECSLIYSQPADASTLSTPGYCKNQDFLSIYPECIRPCPLNYDPLCGSDGVTYGNRCSFEARKCMDKNLKFVHEGSCEEGIIDKVKSKLLCMRYCGNTEVDYVCGSNNVTYLNTCHFENARCKTPELKLFSLGKCPSNEDCEVDCSESQSDTLLCGSNGVTYKHVCEFEKARCMDKDLQIGYYGSCEVSNVDNSTVINQLVASASLAVLSASNCTHLCPLLLHPQCGSDNVTYSNPCEFENAKCLNSSLTLLHSGDCKDPVMPVNCDLRACPLNLLPVCGSDDITYGNKCLFEIAQCKNPDLYLISEDKCEVHQVS